MPRHRFEAISKRFYWHNTRPLYDTSSYVILQSSMCQCFKQRNRRFVSTGNSKATIGLRYWQFKGRGCKLPDQLAIRRPSTKRFSGNSKATPVLPLNMPSTVHLAQHTTFNALLLACRQAGSQGLAPSCNKLARMARAAVRTTKNLPRPSPETPPKHCSGTAALGVGIQTP